MKKPILERKIDHETKTAVVRIEALGNFVKLVEEMGGDAIDLLEKAHIEPESLNRPNAVISYRHMIHLLERTATSLKCPDFGLRLAARQGGACVLGPLEFAMRHSPTLGDAYHYCEAHLQAYSPVVQIRLEPDSRTTQQFIRFEILLDRVPYQAQTVEHALALMHFSIANISSGDVQSRRVWFVHKPISALRTYRNCFGTSVSFGCPFNAVFLDNKDLEIPLRERDPRVYELATSFIDQRFPSSAEVLSAQVRSVTARLLPINGGSHMEVAAVLGMHPRTLQRRLREEGTNFEDIKDRLRRDFALRYFQEGEEPLTRIAAMLGYSEPSVLTRSCYRWFDRSPRSLRRDSLIAASEPTALDI